MKTLIFNGSPRADGDTATLLAKCTESLPGEYIMVNAYRCGIAPCVDCRYCRTHSGCAIHDGMQAVYAYLPACDNILIASPVYFSALTGRLLDVGSRLQTLFSARAFRKETPVTKPKKGAVILVGGGSGSPEPAWHTACMLLRLMHCREIHPLVSSCHTDRVPAREDGAALAGVDSIVRFFTDSSVPQSQRRLQAPS